MYRKRFTWMTVILTAAFLLAFWFVAREISADLREPWFEPTDPASVVRRFENAAVILALGFFFGSFVLAFFAVFGAVAAVNGETEQGTLLSVLSRPIRRWQWYLGRWIGFVVSGVVYAAALFAALLFVAARHTGIAYDPIVVLKAFVLFASVVPLLVSVTMLGSCKWSAMSNGIVMTMLYGIGMLGGMIERILGFGLDESQSRPALRTIAGLMSLAMPADGIQRRMLAELLSVFEVRDLVGGLDHRLGPLGVGQVPSDAFLAYAALYGLSALLAGIAVFRHKDL